MIADPTNGISLKSVIISPNEKQRRRVIQALWEFEKMPQTIKKNIMFFFENFSYLRHDLRHVGSRRDALNRSLNRDLSAL